ncbi:LOW QUALITY PROTEIN: hypothetical protein KIPB_011689, partial [Kipferlia bialata]
EEETLIIIMEMIKGTSLKELIQLRKKKRNSVSESDIISMMTDVFHALLYMHSRGVLHRDIKPDNIMIDESGERPVAKLIDFGLSREVDEVEMAQTQCGSPLYMSPEIVNGDPYDSKSDVWSIGTTFYELLTGRYSVGHPKGLADLFDRVKHCRVVYLTDRDLEVKGLAGVINSMLQASPDDRPSCETLLQNPLFRDQYLMPSVP